VAIRERLAPWRQQPHEAARARDEWLRVYAPGITTRDLTGSANSLSPGNRVYDVGQAGRGLVVSAASQVTTGEMVPGISTGITATFIAEKLGNISGGLSNFIFGEHATGSGAYNWGFYEPQATPTNLNFYIHNGTTGVNVAGSGQWAVGQGPQVWTATYGDGDNNIRLYLNGVQVASIGQTGTIQRNTGALLRSSFWTAGIPNFRLYGAAVANRCMGAAEVADKFGSLADAWNALFEPQRIWVPAAAQASAIAGPLLGGRLTTPGPLIGGRLVQ
jgi:hypothetical protein